MVVLLKTEVSWVVSLCWWGAVAADVR